MIRTYSELILRKDYLDRFQYLKLGGYVGRETFGFDRYLNQDFYRSKEWKRTRDFVIARDDGCDMGVPGWEIYDKVLVHHMNPITIDQIIHGDDDLLNPEYLISVSKITHNAIHYGDETLLTVLPPERFAGDTKLW